SSVPVVVVKDQLAVAGDENVLPTVSIIIADGHPHTKQVRRNPRLLRDVSERAVAVVPIESMIERPGGMVKAGPSRVHQENVHFAVVVVVENSDTRAGGFGQISLIRVRVFVSPRDSAFAGRDFAE